MLQQIVLIMCLVVAVHGFKQATCTSTRFTARRPTTGIKMVLDPHSSVQAIQHLQAFHSLAPDVLMGHVGHMGGDVAPSETYGGLSQLQEHLTAHHWGTSLDLAAVQDGKIYCPPFGEKGWAPFCFLNGNPVFNAFDKFQAFIQGSVTSLAGFVGEKSGGGADSYAYGPSIVLFTLVIRVVLLPLAYYQIQSSQATTALTPKVKEIKEKFPDDKDMQNQVTALLYQEAQANPLAGCLPAIVQIPVFIALYRSFLNLALQNQMNEPFLFLPSLAGPVFGVRSSDWLLKSESWANGVPSLGWHDTLCYLTIPVILMAVQALSLSILTPPSDDPEVQKTQRIFKYLPLLIGYFSLSVPSGLGIYWITNNILSTVTTSSIKAYFKANPSKAGDISIDDLAASMNSKFYNPTWGYKTKEDIVNSAKVNAKPVDNRPIVPPDFV